MTYAAPYVAISGGAAPYGTGTVMGTMANGQPVVAMGDLEIPITMDRLVYPLPNPTTAPWTKWTEFQWLPDPGFYVYSVTSPDATDQNPNPTGSAETRPMKILTLNDAVCFGDCDLEHHGSVTLENAKRYYMGLRSGSTNAEFVKVSGQANPGHTFLGLVITGSPSNINYRFEDDWEDYYDSDGMWDDSPNEDGLYGPHSIYLEMKDNVSVTPVFESLNGIVSTRLSDDELLPSMRGTDLGITPAVKLGEPPAVQNETAVVTYYNSRPGETVSAKIVPIGNAKGHEQYSDYHSDSGRAGKHGSLSAHTSSVDEGCEVHRWTLAPSNFSGKYAVEVKVDGEVALLLPFTVKVPGLVAVQEGARIHLYQSDDDGNPENSIHRKKHPGFYYLTSGFRGILEAIADDYKEAYPLTGSETTKLWVNDCSLEWGGKFEYAGYWGDTPHSAHRRGLEADIATFRQYPNGGSEQDARILKIRTIINEMEGVKIVFEPGVTDHIHIRAN